VDHRSILNTQRNLTREELHDRREEAKRFRRAVSAQVINTYREIAGTVSTSPAIDYSHITGGQNSQYAPPRGGIFTALNFIADVEKAVRDTLAHDELRWYAALLKSERDFLQMQTKQELDVHERMGRTYVERRMYPITEYLIS
jgi:hypothetical protein